MTVLSKDAKRVCQAEVEKFDETHTQITTRHYNREDNCPYCNDVVYDFVEDQLYDAAYLECDMDNPIGRAWMKWDDRSWGHFDGCKHNFGLRRTREASLIAIRGKGVHRFNEDGTTDVFDEYANTEGGSILIQTTEATDWGDCGVITRDKIIVPVIRFPDTKGV